MTAFQNDDELLLLFGQLQMRERLQLTCLSRRTRQLFCDCFPMLLINTAYEQNEMAFDRLLTQQDCACSEYNKYVSLRQLRLTSICLFEKDGCSILRIFAHLFRALRCLCLVTDS